MPLATSSAAPPTTGLADLFAGLADATRLELLRCLIRAGPQSVGELVEACGVRQPSVSKHLACLHGCGLLERERRGRTVVYAVCLADVVALVEAGCRVWDVVQCGEACACPLCQERR